MLLKVAFAEKPQHVILTGDFADFYAVSGHRKDPRRKTLLQDELAGVKALLLELNGATTGAKRVYIGGNHEDRLERYLLDSADALVGLVDIPGALELARYLYTYVPYKSVYKLGKVLFTHDLGYCGPAVAQRALADAQHSIVIGHAHRIGYVVQGDACGKAKVGTCFGWLGDAAKADYMHELKAKRDWALGFGMGYLEPTGVMHLNPVPIVNYRCMVGGKLYRG